MYSNKLKIPNIYTTFDSNSTTSKSKSVRKSNNPRKRVKLLSETQEYRLLQGYLQYRGSDGIIRRGRVALDSQSNTSYSNPKMSLPRDWRPWENKIMIRDINGNNTPLGQPLSFTVIKNGKPINIDTNYGSEHIFKHGVVALLSAQHIHMLGISLDYCLKQTKHVDIKYLSEKKNLPLMG